MVGDISAATRTELLGVISCAFRAISPFSRFISRDGLSRMITAWPPMAAVPVSHAITVRYAELQQNFFEGNIHRNK